MTLRTKPVVRTASTHKRIAARRWLALAASAGLAGLTASARAADQYWDIDGATPGAGGAAPAGAWTGGFWSPNSGGDAATTTWLSGNDAFFAAGSDATGTYTIDVGATQTVRNVTVEEGTVTLGTSGGFTLNAGATWGANAGAGLNVSRAIANGGNLFTINTTGATAISGVISGTGGLTKSGAGTLTLSGANTFTGDVNLSGGVLSVAMGNGITGNLGSATTPASLSKQVFITNNAVFRNTTTFNDNTGSASVLQVVFNIGTGGGTLDTPTGTTLTLDDNTAAGNGNAAAQLQGAGTLTKIGAGTLSLGNGTSNFSTFTGAILINEGTLNLGAISTGGNSLGTVALGTTVAATGATLALNGNNIGTEPLTLNGTGIAGGGALTGNGGTAGGAITLQTSSSVGGPGALSLTGVISGATSALTKVGAGTLTLSGANTYGGGTVLTTGTVVTNNASALGAGAVNVGTGTTLSVAGGSTLTTGTITLNGGTLGNTGTAGTITNAVAAGSAAHTIAPSGVGAIGTLNIGTLTTGANTTLHFDLNGPGTTGDLLNVSGTTTFNAGAGTLVAFNANPAAAGNYRIMDYAGTAPALGNFVLPTPPNARTTYSLSTAVDAGFIDLVVATGPTFASDWLGTGAGPNSWTTAANWTGGNVPGVGGDTANFVNSAGSTNQLVNLDGEQHVGTLTFNNTTAPTPGSYTLQAGTGGILYLDNGTGTATLTNAAGANAITAPVVLSSNTNLAVTDAAASLTVSGPVSGLRPLTLAPTHTGTLTLNGTSTYSGGTVMSSGNLVLDSNAALGTGALTISGGTVSAGTAARTLAGGVNLAGNFTFGGTAATNNLTFSGASSLTAPSTVTVANAAVTDTLSGVVSGAAANTLTKDGPGTLALNGANTFNGNVNLTGGTLAIGNGAGLGAGAKTFTVTNNATFAVNTNYDPASNTVNFVSGTGGSTINVASAVTYTTNDANQFGGTGDVNKAGVGTWILGQTPTPPNYTFTGGYNVTAGTLQVLNTGALGTPSGYTIAAGANVDLRATTSTAAPWTINGTGIGSAGALTSGGAAGTVTGPVTLATASSVGGAGVLNMNGVVSGGAGATLTKVGAGSLRLAGANTYTAGTTLSAGTLIVANTTGSATGSGGVTLNAGTLASGTTGTIDGTVVAGTAAHTVAPGGIAAIGTLNVGGLTTSNLTTLNFDLTGPGTGNDLLNVTGAGAFNAGASTIVSFNANPTAAGNYRLMDYNEAGAAPALGSFTLPAAPNGRTSYALSTAVDPGFIDLIVSVTGGNTDAVWIPGASGRSWNVGTNWTTGIVPTVAGDTASFSTASATPETVNADAQHHISALTFNNPTAAGVYTIAAGTGTGSGLFLDNGTGTATVTNSTNNNVISAPVTLASNANVNAAAGTNLTISGVLSGFPSLTVNPAAGATGTLTLSATNTNSGPITVKGGTLAFTLDNNLGASSAGITLDGGTLSSIGTSGTAVTMTRTITVGPGGGTLATAGATPTTAGKVTLATANQLTGSGTFTKTGGGDLQITAAQNFSGTFNVSGLVEASVAGALGTGTVAVNNGGELAVGNTTNLANNVTANTGGVFSGIGGSGGIVSGPVNAAGNFTVAVRAFNAVGTANGLTFTGPITGSGDLGFAYTTGATNVNPVVTLSGDNSGWSGNISTAGASVINGVALRVASPTALGNTTGGTTIVPGSQLDLNGVNYTTAEPLSVGGTGPNSFPAAIVNRATNTNASFAGPITLTSDTVIGDNTANTTIALSGPIGGAFRLTKANPDTVFLSGNNTFSGGLTHNGGTLSVSADGNLGAAANPITYQAGTFQVTGTALNSFGARPVTITTTTPTFDITNAANNFTLSTALTTGTLTKLGPGTLTLGAASNTVTLLNMNGGTLDIGSGSLSLANGGTNTIRGTANGTINATGGGTLNISGATAPNYGDNSVSAGVTLTINAKVTGPNGFEYCCDAPGGTIVLANPANDFAGDTFLNSSGTISVPAIGAAAAPAGPLGKGSTITFNHAGSPRLLYTGTGESTNRVLAFSNNATVEQGGTGLLKFTANTTAPGNNVKTLTLQGSTAGVGEIAGIILNNSGTSTTSVSKLGTGTWILSGANTYSGTTTISGGTLLAETAGPTNSATGTGAVVVNATGTLGGSGRIGGAVTANLGATISPGSSIGTLTVGGPVTFATGGTGAAPALAVELMGDGTSDLLALSGVGASGVLTLSNPDVLNLIGLEPIGPTPVLYTIATFASESGVFDSVLVNGLPSQSSNPAGSNYALVTYNATNIQVQVANAVPEPTAAGLIGLAALGMLNRRRRRHA